MPVVAAVVTGPVGAASAGRLEFAALELAALFWRFSAARSLRPWSQARWRVGAPPLRRLGASLSSPWAADGCQLRRRFVGMLAAAGAESGGPGARLLRGILPRLRRLCASSSSAPDEAEVDRPLPLQLNDLQGTQTQFEELHCALRARERAAGTAADSGLEAGTVAATHDLLLKEHLTPEAMRDAVRQYLRHDPDLSRDIHGLLEKLDPHLLMHHGLLLEDIPTSLLSRWRAEPDLLGENVGKVIEKLYGKSTQFPILLPAMRRLLGKELRATERRRQLIVERKTLDTAFREYLDLRVEMAKGGRVADMAPNARAWMPWAKEMAVRIEALLASGRKTRASRALQNLELSPELIGILTCQTILNLVLLPTPWKHKRPEAPDHRLQEELMPTAVPFLQAVVAVGEAAIRESSWVKYTGSSPHLPKRKPPSVAMLSSLLRRHSNSLPQSTLEQHNLIVPVGGALVDILLSSAVVEAARSSLDPDDVVAAQEWAQVSDKEFAEMQGRLKVPAFEHKLVREGKKTVGYIVFRRCASDTICLSQDELMKFIVPKHQPMVMRPRPWSPSHPQPEGGFLLLKVPFIRTSNESQAKQVLRQYDTSRLSRVCDMLGGTPWRINRRILDIMDDAYYAKDLGIAALPSMTDPVLQELPTNINELPEEDQNALKLQRHNQVKRINELRSERPTFEQKLTVARDFQYAEHLFFPHNIDFRGRAYPVPPHLNHIGDDTCRGLLMFAEPRPLGKDGFFWLKVSLANLLGKDKLPLHERVAFIDESQDWIEEVARDPLSASSIERWSTADDGPWQALARMFELTKIWRSGDAERFETRLPIHLDGSCNGLQHYAALGRDEWGAKAVNLTPSDRPQDVYSIVLGVVDEKVRKRAEIVDDTAEGRSARQLCERGLLKRKVVKQTIMTICYGVTTVGAKAQVQRQIEALVGNEVEPREIDFMAGYLSKLVLKSIGEVFERAMAIKDWFDSVSKILNKLQIPVSWISPAGLVCMQPYQKRRAVQIPTTRQKVTLQNLDGPLVDKPKQRMGFPPNFVHSLDATHMMLVASACHRHRIQFAGVHDSFWTHPCDAPTLNRIIRSTFFELHSAPILQELHENLTVQLGSHADLLDDLPAKGTLDLSLIMNSPYMFD